MEPTPNENSVGPIVAIILVLAMVVFGGVYFLKERKNDTTDMEQVSSANVEEITATIQTQSSSDDSASIEEDLSNTNVEDLDNGVGDL